MIIYSLIFNRMELHFTWLYNFEFILMVFEYSPSAPLVHNELWFYHGNCVLSMYDR